MLKVIRAIVKNGSTVLFIILQSVCLYWVVKFNSEQQKIFLYSAQLFTSKIQSKVQDWKSYLYLRKRADSLMKENARILASHFNKHSIRFFSAIDSAELTTLPQMYKYEVIPALVVNNSLERLNNMITLNAGSIKGVKPGMGVVTSKGVVGIVTDTSRHFSLALSLLNQKMRLSAKLKRSGFFGAITWNGQNPKILQLEAIQKYADVRRGDTVVTSGYSIIFPEGLMVGTVEYHKVESGAFTYTIQVVPSEDMANLEAVYIIGHPLKEEKDKLEQKSALYE